MSKLPFSILVRLYFRIKIQKKKKSDGNEDSKNANANANASSTSQSQLLSKLLAVNGNDKKFNTYLPLL